MIKGMFLEPEQELVKGTVNEISIYSNMAMLNLQWYPEDLCLNKPKLYIHVFIPLKTVYFLLRFLWKCELSISCLWEAMETLSELNTFRVKKNIVKLYDFRSDKGCFLGYPCELEIAINYQLQSLQRNNATNYSTEQIIVGYAFSLNPPPHPHL